MSQKIVYQFEHIKNGTYQSGYENLEIVDGQAEIDPDNAALIHLAEKWLGGKPVVIEQQAPAVKAKPEFAPAPVKKRSDN